PGVDRPPRVRGPLSAAAIATPLGARLREKRDERGLSLRELARRVEVSPSLVSQIETGKIQPSVRTLYAISSELGLSLDEIFDLNGPSPRPQRGGKGRAIQLETGVHWERLAAWSEPDV